MELGSVYVHPAYQGRRIGKSMVEFAINECARHKKNRLVALTTQSQAFFRDTCGFSIGTLKDLPKVLREKTLRSGRNSVIFVHNL